MEATFFDKNSNNPITEIRTSKRDEVNVQREEHKFSILKQRRLKLSEIETLVQDITVDEIKLLAKQLKKKPTLDILRKIKQSLCSGVPYIEAFFQVDGALNALVSILIGKDAHKQLEAAACITNLACGPHKSTYKIAKIAGAYLVSFIDGGSSFLQDQCAWAAGNIISDCEECFDLLKSQGIIPPLIAALEIKPDVKPNVLQSAMFALNSSTKYISGVLQLMTQNFNLIESLLKVIEQNNTPQVVLVDAAFALCNCSYYMVEKNLEIKIDVASPILRCLKRINSPQIDIRVATPLVRCLGFVSYNDSISDYICRHNNYNSVIKQIMSSNYHHLKKEFLLVINNTLISDEFTIESEVMALLIENFKIMLSPVDSAVLLVLYCLCMLIYKDKQICSLFTQSDLFNQVQSLLSCENSQIEIAVRTFLSLSTNE